MFWSAIFCSTGCHWSFGGYFSFNPAKCHWLVWNVLPSCRIHILRYVLYMFSFKLHSEESHIFSSLQVCFWHSPSMLKIPGVLIYKHEYSEPYHIWLILMTGNLLLFYTHCIFCGCSHNMLQNKTHSCFVVLCCVAFSNALRRTSLWLIVTVYFESNIDYVCICIGNSWSPL